MSRFSNDTYKDLLNIFNLATKRVLKKELSRNKNKHIEYTTILTESYNDYLKYIFQYFDQFDSNNQSILKSNLLQVRDKLNQSFSKILTKFNLPTELREQLNLREILKSNFTEAELTEFRDSSLELPSKSNIDSDSQSGASSNAGSLINLVFENIPVDNMTQPLTRMEFLNFASKTITRNYDGDPLSLQAFINSLELLEDFATADLQQTFCRFVKSKLEKRARECVPDDTNNVKDIIAALKDGIKPDNSKVIAGRILALKPDRSKLDEFSQKAENLAEALQRSLIIEGIPHNKAKEMSIEKTVEVCRNATRSDLVKSILAACQFDSPKEVIAKYLVENATETNEKQILAYRRSQNNNNNRGNFRNNNNNNNRNNNRFNNNNRGNFRNNNNRGNFRNNNNNNRGNFRNNNNNNNNNRGNYNNNGRNNYGNNNNRYNNVRYTGNDQVPQVSLGDVQNDRLIMH